MVYLIAQVQLRGFPGFAMPYFERLPYSEMILKAGSACGVATDPPVSRCSRRPVHQLYH